MIGWGGVHHTSKKASGGGGGEPRVRAPTSGASVDVMREAIMRAFLEDTDESFDWLMQCARETDSASGLSHVNVAHSTGATALMAAAGKGRQMEVSQLLGLASVDPRCEVARREQRRGLGAISSDTTSIADAWRSEDDEHEDAGSHEQSALSIERLPARRGPGRGGFVGGLNPQCDRSEHDEERAIERRRPRARF